MNPIEAINDFVIKFANVNGSGSASANELFAKSILRMGVPVSPRNIFPSNIQGLPTWYEVRICEHGWQGRRVVLGVTGGIAAYKSVQVARDLTRLGAQVDVILTPAAERFVGGQHNRQPLTTLGP